LYFRNIQHIQKVLKQELYLLKRSIMHGVY